MKAIFISALAFTLLLGAGAANAASQVGQHYIDRIANGGPATVRDAAKSVREARVTEVEVLDALAERTWRDFQKSGRAEIDAVAWGIITLGDSGNSRYHTMMQTITNEAIEKKVKKHAVKALKQLKDASVPQYALGSYKLVGTASAQAAPAAAPATTRAGGKAVPLSEIPVGMSIQEVEALAGMPTATNSHITGKQFNPFNFKGGDTARVIYHYKGQGRVVFSKQSHYNNAYRVMDVVIDPNETGYP